jgi:hypothetical protein
LNPTIVLTGAIIFNDTYTGDEITYTLRMPNIESGRGYSPGQSWSPEKITDSPTIQSPQFDGRGIS